MRLGFQEADMSFTGLYILDHLERRGSRALHFGRLLFYGLEEHVEN